MPLREFPVEPLPLSMYMGSFDFAIDSLCESIAPLRMTGQLRPILIMSYFPSLTGVCPCVRI